VLVVKLQQILVTSLNCKDTGKDTALAVTRLTRKRVQDVVAGKDTALAVTRLTRKRVQDVVAGKDAA
jgi:hypothetical protein